LRIAALNAMLSTALIQKIAYGYENTATSTIYKSRPRNRWKVSAVYRGPKKTENLINKWFVNFKTRAKRERAVNMVRPSSPNMSITWLTLLCPVPTLPRRTYQHSASSVLAVRMRSRVPALSQYLLSESPYLSIKLQRIYACYTNITLYIPVGIIRCFT
jgi:hypothetical protein